jgi:hypothetical protein
MAIRVCVTRAVQVAALLAAIVRPASGATLPAVERPTGDGTPEKAVPFRCH